MKIKVVLIQAQNHNCKSNRTSIMQPNFTKKRPIFWGLSPLYDNGTHICVTNYILFLDLKLQKF